MTEITPDYDGWERLTETVQRDVEFDTNHNSEDSLSFHPVNHVDITITYEDRSGNSTVDGVLIEARKSLNQDRDEREQNRHNGWFGKVRTSDGFVNVYADPDTGGERIIFVSGWNGRGGRRYKWPIQSITVEEDTTRNPTDPKCGEEMEFGIYHGSPDDHYGPSMGWICRTCAAGHGLGRFESVDIEQGLP